MKVLFATSEFTGLAKAGGLGDVSAGLPRALRHRGMDARVLMPAYPDVLSNAGDITIVAYLPGHAGVGPCAIGEVRMADGLTLYLVIEPSLYQRAGNPYAGPEGSTGRTTICALPVCHWPRRTLPPEALG
jgi:starch synthase